MSDDYNNFEGVCIFCGCLSCKYREPSGRCLLAEETGKYPQVHCKNYFLYAEEIPESEVE